MFLLVFHALCAYVYGYTIKFDYDLTKTGQVRLPVDGVFMSKFVWLTMINLYVQFLYNVSACLLLLYEAVIGRANGWKASIHKSATTLVFPIATTVVVLFWGLVFFDPNFLMDEAAKKILSIAWFNHAIHTLPLLTVILDHIGWRHPRSKKLSALVNITTFVVLYLAGVHYVYYAHNFWAYPILGELDTPQRAVFIAGCVLFFFVAFLLSDTLLAVLRPTKAKRAKKTR